jgi:hypothetical protein
MSKISAGSLSSARAGSYCEQVLSRRISKHRDLLDLLRYDDFVA